jgi:hypothetical protein
MLSQPGRFLDRTDLLTVAAVALVLLVTTGDLGLWADDYGWLDDARFDLPDVSHPLYEHLRKTPYGVFAPVSRAYFWLGYALFGTHELAWRLTHLGLVTTAVGSVLAALRAYETRAWVARLAAATVPVAAGTVTTTTWVSTGPYLLALSACAWLAVALRRQSPWAAVAVAVAALSREASLVLMLPLLVAHRSRWAWGAWSIGVGVHLLASSPRTATFVDRIGNVRGAWHERLSLSGVAPLPPHVPGDDALVELAYVAGTPPNGLLLAGGWTLYLLAVDLRRPHKRRYAWLAWLAPLVAFTAVEPHPRFLWTAAVVAVCSTALTVGDRTRPWDKLDQRFGGALALLTVLTWTSRAHVDLQACAVPAAEASDQLLAALSTLEDGATEAGPVPTKVCAHPTMWNAHAAHHDLTVDTVRRGDDTWLVPRPSAEAP